MSYDQKIECITGLVNTIIHEIEEGNTEILEIVALIKETVFIDQDLEEMKKPISLLTTNICNSKGIKKEELLDTLDKRNIPIFSADSALLSLITAIELLSVECRDIEPIIASSFIDDTKPVEIKTEENGKTKIEEGKSLSVSTHPQVMDHDTSIPELKKEIDNIKPYAMSLDANESQVCKKIVDCSSIMKYTLCFIIFIQLQKRNSF